MSPKLSLSDIIHIAKSRGGRCLSEEYINCETSMLWECTRKLARNRGSQCLSKNYINSYVPMLWKCSKKHQWCPYCASKKLNISVAQKLALNKNGRCISENYINNSSPLLWECGNKHQFRLSLGGTCSSIFYHNRRTPLSWSCSKGHSCLARIDSIQRGTWCPRCIKNRRLELDIYYPQYGLAIEIQGKQHEYYNNFFHKGKPENLIKQQKRDQIKKDLCEENWIVLREVWYYEDPYKVIPDILRELGLIE
ncbi:hypothetical protein Glove_161g42 [Diversispora epigaea]|uniref:Zinc-ribbon domain-containing protein n=1 Tax=Diversispora epigaea TaxID=1348612 RepID=A0A397IU67_9GLOM|nr:hypothetical protein Glove_161g42 [Diversispora epigaea]